MSTTSDYYEKRIEENVLYNAKKQEHIDYCNSLIAFNKKKMEAINQQISDFFRRWRVDDLDSCNKKQSSTITALMKQSRMLSSNNISLGNNIFSAQLAIFNTTLDTSQLINEKNLFERLS